MLPDNVVNVVGRPPNRDCRLVSVLVGIYKLSVEKVTWKPPKREIVGVVGARFVYALGLADFVDKKYSVFGHTVEL